MRLHHISGCVASTARATQDGDSTLSSFALPFEVIKWILGHTIVRHPDPAKNTHHLLAVAEERSVDRPVPSAEPPTVLRAAIGPRDGPEVP